MCDSLPAWCFETLGLLSLLLIATRFHRCGGGALSARRLSLRRADRKKRARTERHTATAIRAARSEIFAQAHLANTLRQIHLPSPAHVAPSLFANGAPEYWRDLPAAS